MEMWITFPQPHMTESFGNYLFYHNQTHAEFGRMLFRKKL